METTLDIRGLPEEPVEYLKASPNAMLIRQIPDDWNLPFSSLPIPPSSLT